MEEQKAHFVKHGYVRLKGCCSLEKAAEWTKDVWIRLGMDPNDKTTWTSERINILFHIAEDVRTFVPKAWAAICELLGGEERIVTLGNDHPRDDYEKSDVVTDVKNRQLWTDGLIVNLGTSEGEGKHIDLRDLPGWHIDGDFFVHYLDSSKHGLLVTFIYCTH